MVKLECMNMNSVSKFGDFIRKRRAVLRKTLREFSREIGIDPAYISRLERGLLRSPKDTMLQKLAMGLKLEVDSEEWTEFQRLAAIEKEKKPINIIDDKFRAPKMFRAMRGPLTGEEELDNFVEHLIKYKETFKKNKD